MGELNQEFRWRRPRQEVGLTDFAVAATQAAVTAVATTATSDHVTWDTPPASPSRATAACIVAALIGAGPAHGAASQKDTRSTKASASHSSSHVAALAAPWPK